MTIRLAARDDFPRLEEIFAYAREQMKLNGNPNQWKDNRPSPRQLIRDIENGNLYVLTEKEEICGVFAFIIGEDPTYTVIEEGSWPNDEPYGTIHRVAKGPGAHGVMETVLAFCEARMDNIRVDTHEDNRIMQHLLETHGFQRCGIIYTDDNTPRLAYHKLVRQ